MPIILWAIFGLVGLALVGDNVDQREQRGNDYRKYRKDLGDKEARIAELDRTIAALKAALGESHEMVRSLLAERAKLRAQVMAMGRDG